MDVTETILQEGVDFKVTVLKKNALHKLKILKPYRTFVIYPICLGALLKISRLLFDVKSETVELQEGLSDSDFIGLGVDSIVKNKDRMIEIIALAIVNAEKDPSKSLVKYLNRNLTSKEALTILTIIVKQMDIQDFLAFMMSVGGMNLLTSPTSGELSEESKTTSDSVETKSSGKSVGQTS